MNYTVVGERLIFRTTPDTEAGRCANGVQVAFEVDQIDEFLHAGLERAGHRRGPSDHPPRIANCSTSSRSPDPWPEGERPLFLQLPLTTMTGRRVRLTPCTDILSDIPNPEGERP